MNELLQSSLFGDIYNHDSDFVDSASAVPDGKVDVQTSVRRFGSVGQHSVLNLKL